MVNTLKISNKKAGVNPAFTMVELVFVIVVLGILAAVAIPKLAASRDDAILVKGKSQVSAIRSGIAMQKNKRLLEGKNPPIPRMLEGNTTSLASISPLFNGGEDGNILEYGLPNQAKSGHWEKTNANTNNPMTYKFYLDDTTSVSFDYNKTNGSFDCDHSNQDCKDLTE